MRAYAPEPARNCPARRVAHPGGENTTSPSLYPNPHSPAMIALGPEGGGVDFEIDLFRKQGFSCFSFGPHILRVDTAVPAILSQFQLLRTLDAGNWPLTG